ncbi:chromogranin-A [Latimeria chalumnae]|uniref:chromogranin-A n=1 Tax=Latimeria chalumnae TaxID=7897 RepID=UPI0006D8DA08|nr:PREDICTED: chromogranin-A [Latimeria chalumnae]|eukprot:XP_014341366.1 PREDICTED: chromogranin-A [Latimeria chalumnae]
MNCIEEVLANTLSKPKPLPISEDCMDILRRDEKILAILHHQNLLRELQELAAQGAGERSQPQKKTNDFVDELSEVLQSQLDKNIQTDKSSESPAEEQAGSFADTAEEKDEKYSVKDDSKAKEKNSVEDNEANMQGESTGEDKETAEEPESNEVSEEQERLKGKQDNHIRDDWNGNEPSEEKHRANEEFQEDTIGSDKSVNAEEDASRKSDEKTKEENDSSDQEDVDASEVNDHSELEKKEYLSQEDEDEESQSEGTSKADVSEDEEASDADTEEKISEEEDKSSEDKRESLNSIDEELQGDETLGKAGKKNGETEEERSEEWENSKRWSKMEELTSKLTSKKSTESNESGQDPDRSMKIPFRARNNSFGSGLKKSWGNKERQVKEDSIESALQMVTKPDIDEKREEEGSANRRTEDQELENLAAIEAELERVARRLYMLRTE